MKIVKLKPVLTMLFCIGLAFFTETFAQKFEFKTTTKSTSSMDGDYEGESDEIFVIDLKNNQFTTENEIIKIKNLTQFRNDHFKFHQYDFESESGTNFSLIIYDDENEKDGVISSNEYHYDMYFGKAIELKN